MLKLEEFQPKIVDKEAFIRHYDRAKLDTVIEDIGWVSEAYRLLHSLDLVPDSSDLQKRVWCSITGMQHDLPLGIKADLQLQELKAYIQKSGDYKDMQRYRDVLDDLTHGYRKILKERHEEL